MSLSEKTKLYIKYSLTNQEVADEVISYLETDPDAEAALAAHVASANPHSQYLQKGSVIWCLPGGEYSSLQQAIDAASAGQIIILGAGSWGNATLKGGVDIVGLGAACNVNIVVGQLSFAPTTGNASNNQIFLSNLLISANASGSGITLGGSAPARLNVHNCYVFGSSGTSNLITLNNTDATATSVKLDSCVVNSGGSTGTLITSSVRYLRITNCELSNASKALVVSGGLAQIAFSSIETNSSTEIIQIAAGSVQATSSSLIRNLTAGGSGVSVAAGGTFFATTLTLFDVADGAGYCVKGSGTVVYDSISFNHIPIVQPRNTKFQNTLTVVTLPTTPTSAA